MNYYNTVMQQAEELPENIKCPYCGAANSTDSEFCGVCFKNLRIPAGRGAETENRKIFNAGPSAGLAENIPAVAHPARLWVRLILAAGLFLYYLQWCRHENYFSMLDFVNLAFHEAGHVFLGLFPRFIAMAGGTIFQLAIPAVCLAHLSRLGANLGWQLCLFWLGENLLNISIYAGDAIRQELPLVGGSEHDWTYLLTEIGLIAHTTGTAKAIFFAGSAVIFLSLFLICRDAIRHESLEV
ncbi:MAG: hypothetical protein A2218_04980 [Elusimicrobia bacterium RIFOXYA2_FULL_53_38]|nr:MAG: hypothetical protein A2218_04980 [Elusimicrobia bacterium RIFOXYA2_FULL_53_38]